MEKSRDRRIRPQRPRRSTSYLGDDFIVKASMGHIRDLPPRGGMAWI